MFALLASVVVALPSPVRAFQSNISLTHSSLLTKRAADANAIAQNLYTAELQAILEQQTSTLECNGAEAEESVTVVGYYEAKVDEIYYGVMVFGQNQCQAIVTACEDVLANNEEKARALVQDAITSMETENQAEWCIGIELTVANKVTLVVNALLYAQQTSVGAGLTGVQVEDYVSRCPGS